MTCPFNRAATRLAIVDLPLPDGPPSATINVFPLLDEALKIHFTKRCVFIAAIPRLTFHTR